MTDTNASRTQRRLKAATQGLDAPIAIIDLAALTANRLDLARRAGSTPIRVASKSLRVRWVLAEILRHEQFQGALAFTLAEAMWLATDSPGWTGLRDVVIGYPSVERNALRQLAADPLLAGRITLMIDDLAHVDMLETIANAGGNRLRVSLDIDASWRPRPPGLNEPLHIGVRRSPVHSADHAVALTRCVLAARSLSLVGMMFYEAQIAGVGDRPPGRPVRGRLIHLMQRASAHDLLTRRPEIVAAVSAELAKAGERALEFVNAGGTGSLELSSADPSVTEVTAGSGLFGPTLFDTYSHFHPHPAAAFGLSIVRRPAPGIVTVLGGGYLASGVGDASRLPSPWLPAGLLLDRQEGAGEVQTPLRGEVADQLAIGDRVWFRHCKSGELAERFNHFHLVDGEEIVDVVPTYRGEGKAFL